VTVEGEVVARVRFADERAAPNDTTAKIRRNLLRLLASTLGRLCRDATELRDRVADLSALYRLTARFSERRDLQDVLHSVTQTVVDTLKAKACSIRLLSDDGTELVVAAAHSFSPQYLDKRPIPLAESPLDREVLASVEPIAVADMTTDPRVVYREESRREGIVSGLCARMVYKDRPEGILRVFMDQPHSFTWFDKQLLRAIAGAAAAAIVNARLYEEAVDSWRIKRQVAMAAEIQQRMIPQQPPAVKGFDIHGLYLPSQQLSGDFYDFIDLPPDNLGIAICDVVGKGIPASLLMATIRAALRAHAANVFDMSQVLEKVNRDLCAGTVESDFATMFYGVLDAPRRRLTYACAGHMPPILVRGGQVCHLETSGGIIGAWPDMEFPRASFVMQPGDVVFAYTDGLSEATNFAGEEYGRERIETALVEACRGNFTAEGIAKLSAWHAQRFTGLNEQQDDLTLVVVKAA
jgi:sigma-B regulation protein RsbU (phosphoserine phosphatase)